MKKNEPHYHKINAEHLKELSESFSHVSRVLIGIMDSKVSDVAKKEVHTTSLLLFKLIFMECRKLEGDCNMIEKVTD